jgi:hypothetical protein
MDHEKRKKRRPQGGQLALRPESVQSVVERFVTAAPLPVLLGRPRRQPELRERVQLSLRVTPHVKGRLDLAALLSGRSQSMEAEMRIEQSFDREDLLSEVLVLAYGRSLARLLLIMGNVMVAVGRRSQLARLEKGHPRNASDDWALDEGPYQEALRAALRVLDTVRPDQLRDNRSVDSPRKPREILERLLTNAPEPVVRDQEIDQLIKRIQKKLRAARQGVTARDFVESDDESVQ